MPQVSLSRLVGQVPIMAARSPSEPRVEEMVEEEEEEETDGGFLLSLLLSELVLMGVGVGFLVLCVVGDVPAAGEATLPAVCSAPFSLLAVGVDALAAEACWSAPSSTTPSWASSL